jgi:hypothetical protein
MHSTTGGDVQIDGRNDGHGSVVSDLISLIEHMQASMKMLEGAIARELPQAAQEPGDNVVFWMMSRPATSRRTPPCMRARPSSATRCIFSSAPVRPIRN